MTECDWCGETITISMSGIIVIHEKAPLEEYLDDEIYNFCCYKCLARWVEL